jgi:hypothetical protein
VESAQLTKGARDEAVGSYNWTGPYSTTPNSFTLSNVPNYDGEGHTGSFVFTPTKVIRRGG